MSIHEGHRERMRKQLKTSGMDSLSDVQVLEVLLYYAAPRGDTNPAAHALLSRAAHRARAAGGPPLPHEPQRAD